LQWLNEAKIIQRLVELIHSSQDEDRQSNASQTLCDIIRLSRDQSNQLQDIPEPDPLLTALESQECVEQLLKNMFDGEQTENCIVNGTQVLLTLLETRRSGVEGLMDSYTQGFERSYTVNSSILHGIEPRLKDFHQLLLSPPKVKRLTCVPGFPFPYAQASWIFSESTICCNIFSFKTSFEEKFMHKLKMNAGVFSVLLSPKEKWKSLLRIGSVSVSERKLCFTAGDVTRGGNFLSSCLAEGGMRRGNMGHLTRIANAVVQNMEKGPMQTQISEFIKELPEDCRGRWESFVEETLTETNRRNTVDLVSTHHLHSSSEDEDIESAFPNELSLQQAFSEYQIQQMTANFVDQFGFNDEEFADQDDNINAPFDRIAEINFNIDADDDSPNASLFEACCNERIQQFDDNEEEEDIWEEKEITYATQVKSRTR
ncbi:Serine/threonine-protein phosphatase 6 regulatory subunit 3, partial [Phalacrocorax carbo]